MAFPGVITSLTGAYTLGEVDEECAGWVVRRRGRIVGVYLDDTTPNLGWWIGLAVAKYGPLGLIVFVAVAPGDAGLHHGPRPPVVNLLEVYIYGMAAPPSAWPRVVPRYAGYIIQWDWPGVVGKVRPTRRQRALLLARVMLRCPRYVFLY